jgi:pilus assembly protein CpaB
MKILRGGKGVLVIAVAMGALTSFLAWRYLDEAAQSAPAPVPTVSVVVAARPLADRTVITPDMLRVKQIPAEAAHPNAVHNTADAVGKVVRTTMTTDEQVLTTKLFLQREESGLAFMVPNGMRAVSVNFTEVIGSGGLIMPGDRVDVIATFKKDVMGKDQAMILLQNVPVLAVAQSTSPDELEPAAAATPTAPGAPKMAAATPNTAAPVAAPAKPGTPTAGTDKSTAPSADGAGDKVLPATPTPVSVKAAPAKAKTVASRAASKTASAKKTASRR